MCFPDLSRVLFPPGLLAANPSLAGDKPGSLVVVEGPQKPQHSRNPMALYMVQVNEKKSCDKNQVTARTVGFSNTDLRTELRLDPAVIRAVDGWELHRQRTLSESEERSLRPRQRTHRESSAQGQSVIP